MATVLRSLAIVASAFVALGFMTFAADRSRQGSDGQVQAVDGSRPQPVVDQEIDRPAPPPRTERRREKANSGFREVIDDGNDYLLAPFTFVNSDNVWVERMVPAAVALLAYGLGGLLLANFIPAHRRASRNWREATP
jgi:hypothetical protein